MLVGKTFPGLHFSVKRYWNFKGNFWSFFFWGGWVIVLYRDILRIMPTHSMHISYKTKLCIYMFLLLLHLFLTDEIPLSFYFHLFFLLLKKILYFYYWLFSSQWDKKSLALTSGNTRQNENFIMKKHKECTFSHPSGKIFQCY